MNTCRSLAALKRELRDKEEEKERLNELIREKREEQMKLATRLRRMEDQYREVDEKKAL